MKKLFNLLFIALAAVALSSCSGLLNSNPMDKADTYKKALDVVKGDKTKCDKLSYSA